MPEPICHKTGCRNEAIPCFLIDDDEDQPSYHYCPDHAYDHGFCAGCGRFNDGIENFEFNNPLGVCDICEDMINADFGEYDEPDDVVDCDYVDFQDAVIAES